MDLGILCVVLCFACGTFACMWGIAADRRDRLEEELKKGKKRPTIFIHRSRHSPRTLTVEKIYELKSQGVRFTEDEESWMEELQKKEDE